MIITGVPQGVPIKKVFIGNPCVSVKLLIGVNPALESKDSRCECVLMGLDVDVRVVFLRNFYL